MAKTKENIRIHPSFKRLCYAFDCDISRKEWYSANPDINTKSNCKNWKTRCSLLGLAICIIGMCVDFYFCTIAVFYGDIAPYLSFRHYENTILILTVVFGASFYWFSYKDEFYCLFPEEVDDYMKQEQEELTAKKETANEKLEKHHYDAQREMIEVR